MQAKRCWWILLINLIINTQTAQPDKYPPRSQGTPNLQYDAEIGAVKRLRCGVSGQPPPTIIWFKDDKPLQFSERVKNLNNNKTIKIRTIILRDQGNYTCIAENTLGKLNLTLELKVRQGISPSLSTSKLTPTTQVLTTQVQTKDASTSSRTKESRAPRFSDPSMFKRAFRAWPASHTIRLKCRATGATPLKYTWLKDGVKLSRRRLDPYLNASLWYLRLTQLVPNDSGKYTCIVSNQYGSINHTYTLQVVAKPKSRPILQRGLPKNTTVQIGDNATMTCIVLVSGTLPDFRWLKWDKSVLSIKKNGDLENGPYHLIDPHHYKTIRVKDHYGVELRITNVTEDDFGLYTCLVSNHIGKDYNSAFLSKYVKPTVPVKAKPRSPPILQKDLPKNTTVQIGHNATMTCIVLVSGTLPDFRWLKWDKSVLSIKKIGDDLENGAYNLIDSHYYKTFRVKDHYGLELRITNVTEDDFGLYTCLVSNHIGKNYNSAFLSKEGKPTAYVKGFQGRKEPQTKSVRFYVIISVAILLSGVLVISAIIAWYFWQKRKLMKRLSAPTGALMIDSIERPGSSIRPRNEYVFLL